MYRVGAPGWKVAARLGVQMKLRLDLLRDKEAGVFVATSPDLRGLVLEAETMEELLLEIDTGVHELMTEYLRRDVPKHPHTDLRLDAALCGA